jgi:hypothetical protein
VIVGIFKLLTDKSMCKLDLGRAIPFLRIFVSDFRHCVFAVYNVDFINRKQSFPCVLKVEMAHRISSALFKEENKTSKGQQMYINRAKKSGKITAPVLAAFLPPALFSKTGQFGSRTVAYYLF